MGLVGLKGLLKWAAVTPPVRRRSLLSSPLPSQRHTAAQSGGVIFWTRNVGESHVGDPTPTTSLHQEGLQKRLSKPKPPIGFVVNAQAKARPRSAIRA